MDVDTVGQARARIGMRIDGIARDYGRMRPEHLACAIDDIRRDACASRLDGVAALAAALECTLAGAGGARGALVLPYLDAIGQAAASSDDSPAAARAWLASVAVRAG